MNTFCRFASAFMLLLPTCLAAETEPAQPDSHATRPTVPIQVWEIDVPGTAVPLLCGLTDAIVIARRAGQISAHSASDGGLVWEIELPGPLSRPPVCAGDRVALVLDDGGFFLLDAATGGAIAEDREGPPGAMVSALPSGMALSDPEGGLRLFRSADGQPAWSSRIDGAYSVAPAQCGEVILTGTQDGRLIAVVSGDGAVKWERRIDDAITTPAACHDRWIYVGSADNKLHSLKMKRKKARRRWQYRTGGDLSGRPLTSGHLVLFLSYDTYLYALDVDNGHLAWKVRLGRRPQPDGLLAGQTLLLAPLNSESLESFDLPEGTRTTTLTLEGDRDRFVTPPVLAGDTIAIAAARYGEESARIIGLRRAASPGR